MTNNKSEKTKKFFIYSLLCGIVCFALVFCASSSLNLMSYGIIERLDQVWLDSLFKFRQQYFGNDKRYHASDDIKLILFDHVSDKELGLFWPYDRAEIAKIVDYLAIVESKNQIYDLIFKVPKTQTEQLIKSDSTLINAVKEAQNVYLGAKVLDFGQNKVEIEKLPAKYTVDIDFLNQSNLKNTYLSQSSNFILIPPFKDLLLASKNIGFFTSQETNKDHKSTQDLFFCKSDNNCVSSLPLTPYLELKDINKVSLAPGSYYLLKSLKIPLNHYNRLYINWLGGSDSIVELNKKIFSLKKQEQNETTKKEIQKLLDEKANQKKFVYDHKSAWKIIKDYEKVIKYQQENNIDKKDILKHFDYIPGLKVNPRDFQNKYVFIGTSDNGAEDLINTPYGIIPGVYSHAFTLDSLLNNNFIKPINFYWNILFLLLICLITSVTVFFASSKDSFLSIGLPFAYLLLFSIISIFLFGEFGIIVSFIDYFLAILISTLCTIYLYFSIEGKSKKLIKAAMSNYLSPQILKEVMENPDKLKSSASQRKELTILFSDIRGFTTFSEKNPAELVVKMLNEYLFDMTNIIFKHEGTLDKFIGDAVMAFWGAPVDVEDQALKTVKTALEMKEKVIELNEIWKKVYKHTVQIGIGINTEEVVVGNLGSEIFMDYTVIGDGVNLAARLESLNKTYETTIIISEYTYRHVKDYVEVRYLDRVKVKGKAEDTLIYELIDLKEEYK